jgi:hypothetical protein
MSFQPAPPDGSQPAAWHADPWGRAEYRYWDGQSWTEHVSTGGVQRADKVEAAQPAAAAEPPSPGPAAAAAPASPTRDQRPRVESDLSVPLFGARGRARELASEVTSLRAEVQRLSRLDLLTVAELEARREELEREVAEQQARLERERAEALVTLQGQLADLSSGRNALSQQLAELRADVVTTEESAVLQEVGVYEYRHPLSDAVAYQTELRRMHDMVKTMTRKDGGAVLGTTSWQVNGSSAQGRAMVRDFSKLMLRAYNAEADNMVRSMKPYKLVSAIERLTKVANTIVKLGRTMDIRISDEYHRLRVQELELTADYLELQAQQKEREREERERLREERRVQQEMERERARLEKERQHFTNALNALMAKSDDAGAERLREQLTEVERRIEDVDYRAANVRAGYVYVISNVGSFGEKMVKVGLTRRLDPRERVRELGDASVPFRFDVHAVFFSKDAVGIEGQLHERLADRRVNEVNRRREFFYATPNEVKAHLAELTGELLEFEELPEALEYRQSSQLHEAAPTPI